ncbi:hypothetical protein D560_1053 [Bordetella holmesii ATCC 51541]|nr:hypothetical protein D560_1053 [Bordetella holmesii ATCC 51541]
MADPQARRDTQAGHLLSRVRSGAGRGSTGCRASLFDRGDILAALSLSGPGDAESGEDQPPDHMHE